MGRSHDFYVSINIRFYRANSLRRYLFYLARVSIFRVYFGIMAFIVPVMKKDYMIYSPNKKASVRKTRSDSNPEPLKKMPSKIS